MGTAGSTVGVALEDSEGVLSLFEGFMRLLMVGSVNSVGGQPELTWWRLKKGEIKIIEEFDRPQNLHSLSWPYSQFDLHHSPSQPHPKSPQKLIAKGANSPTCRCSP